MIETESVKYLYATKDDVNHSPEEVFDPSPISNSGNNSLFMGATARGKKDEIEKSPYILWRFDDARRETGVSSVNDITNKLNNDLFNRVVGMRTGPRVSDRTFEDYSKEIILPTWPRASWAESAAECGSLLENPHGGVGTEDRLNLKENFGVWVSVKVSDTFDPTNYNINDSVVIFDRCGYFRLKFIPAMQYLSLYMETEGDETYKLVPTGIKLAAGGEYIIGCIYQSHEEYDSVNDTSKIYAMLSIGVVNHPSGTYTSARKLFTWSAKAPYHQIRNTPLGSMTLLSDWSGANECTSDILGITSFRVDIRDDNWGGNPSKSYWYDATALDTYLAGLKITGALLSEEPGTVCLLHPNSINTGVIQDKSEKGGYDFRMLGDSFLIDTFNGSADADHMCYATNAKSGSYKFGLFVPTNSAEELLADAVFEFRLYDDTGHSEVISQDRIKKIELDDYIRKTLRGDGSHPDIICKFYWVHLYNVPGNALSNDYDMSAKFFNNLEFTPHPNGLAYFQKTDTTRNVLVKQHSAVNDICFSKPILPPHRYKLFYLGTSEHPDVHSGDKIYSVMCAYSNDLDNWTSNTRQVPLYKWFASTQDIEKIHVFMDGEDTLVLASDITNGTIQGYYTQDSSGWDINVAQDLGDILFTRPDTFDSNKISAPSVSADRTGNYALVYSGEDSSGEVSFGVVYSANLFKWTKRRALEPFLRKNNRELDVNKIGDPSKFFEFDGLVYIAYTGYDASNVRSICFSRITADALVEPDTPDDDENIFEEISSLEERVKGLHEYRYEDYSTIIMAAKKSILRDNGDGNFRSIRTHWRVMKQSTLVELSDLDYFFTTAKSFVVGTCGDNPNIKYHNDDAWASFLGIEQADAPHTLTENLGAGSLAAGDYKYAISWESTSIEGNISDETEITGITAGSSISMRLPLPYHRFGSQKLEDHYVQTINVWRKYKAPAGSYPNTWDWMGAYTIVLADWQTSVDYVDYTDSAASAPSGTRQPYTRHGLPPQSKFCVFNPSANRLVLFDETNCYYSDTDYIEAFPPENEINLDDGSGDIIKGAVLFRNDIYVFFEKKTMKIIFRGNDIFPVTLEGSIGVMASRSIAVSPIGIFALTNDGIRKLDGSGWSADISRNVKYYLDLAIDQGNKYWKPGSVFNSVNPSGIWLANGSFFDDVYSLDIPFNSNFPRIRLKFFTKNRTWSVGKEFRSSVQLPVLFGSKKLLWGSVHNPTIFKVGGDSDNGIPVESVAITKSFNFNREDLYKQLYEIFPRIDSQSGSMDISIIIDKGVEQYTTKFATPEQFSIMAWIVPGLTLLGSDAAIVPVEALANNKRRAVVPDYMIFKKVSFKFYDNGKGSRSEVKGISLSFTYEDSELV